MLVRFLLIENYNTLRSYCVKLKTLKLRWNLQKNRRTHMVKSTCYVSYVVVRTVRCTFLNCFLEVMIQQNGCTVLVHSMLDAEITSVGQPGGMTSTAHLLFFSFPLDKLQVGMGKTRCFKTVFRILKRLQTGF